MAFAVGIQSTAAYDASVRAPVISPIMPEVAEADAGAALVAAPHPVAAEPASAPAPAPAPEPVKGATLDYKSEVAPMVLKLVEMKGKPAAQAVLDEFGVVKASEIPAERWGELVDMIKERLV